MTFTRVAGISGLLCILSVFVWVVAIPGWEVKRFALLSGTIYEISTNVHRDIQSEQVFRYIHTINDCDRYRYLQKEDQTLVPLIPDAENGFLIRFCNPSSYRINGVTPDSNILAVIGLSFEGRALYNTKNSKNLIPYYPTNGIYSKGDLLFEVKE